jgi:hypothetical protein
VEGMIESAAAVRAGGVIVYASGFAETSKPDRVEAQQRLLQLANGPACVSSGRIVLGSPIRVPARG